MPLLIQASAQPDHARHIAKPRYRTFMQLTNIDHMADSPKLIPIAIGITPSLK